MKTDIHPNYAPIDVEISSESHPFYTGKQRIMDSAGRVEKFNSRYSNFGTKKDGSKPAAAKSDAAE